MMRLPWYGKTVPHAVLDILRGCNCRCANCYNSVQPCAKSLDSLKSELAVIRAARNVTTISLSGGEPLMHPQILDIIAWLRSEGLKASMLTNGILFDEALAGKLHAAGLDFVTFHIQKGQVRPDCDDECVDAVRCEKGRIARAHGIYPAIVETIRADDAEGFAALGRFLRVAPEFEYALVTVARDFAAINPDVAESELDRAPIGMSCKARRPSVRMDANAHGTWCVRDSSSDCSSGGMRFFAAVRSIGCVRRLPRQRCVCC